MASQLPREEQGSTLVCRPQENEQATLRLRLKKKEKKRVVWTEDTIDNEHMNKKKSKCCCIYEKPKEFGESSSDTDDECDHCRGHVEKKKRDPSGDNGPDEPSDSDPKN